MNIKHYISAAMLALVGLGFTACDGKDEPTYTPASKPGESTRVYFAKNKIKEVVSDETTEVQVPIYRAEEGSDKELTVQILPTFTGDSNEELFTVAGEVTFGENETFAFISVDIKTDAMTRNKDYSIFLAVDDANANLYGMTETELVLNFEYFTDWTLLKGKEEGQDGYGSYTVGSPFEVMTFSPIRVFERHVPSTPNVIEYLMQIYDGEEEDEAAIPHDDDFDNPEWLDVWNFSTDDSGKTIKLPLQAFSLANGWYLGEASELFPDEFKNGSSFNPENGVFTFNIMAYDGEYAYGPGKWFIRLNGYADTNVYSLSVSDQGQINVADTDYSIIRFDLSDAIDIVEYTVVEIDSESEGLSDEEVDEIIEKIQDPEQTEYEVGTVKESGVINLTFPSSGKFEIIAVGYHNNGGNYEVKATDTCVFTFKTFDPYAGWKTIATNVEYTDHLFATQYEGVPNETLYCDLAQSEEFPDTYRLTNPYANSEIVDLVGLEHASFGSIEFVITQENIVYFPFSSVGIIEGGNEWSICSYAYYLLANDTPASDIPEVLWGTNNNGKVTLDATGMSQMTSFLFFLGQKGYYCDMDFFVDMNSGSAAAAPAKKAKKSVMDKLTPRAFRTASFKKPVFPARYKATFKKEAVKTTKKGASKLTKVSTTRHHR